MAAISANRGSFVLVVERAANLSLVLLCLQREYLLHTTLTSPT